MKLSSNKKYLNEYELDLLKGSDIVVDLLRNRKEVILDDINKFTNLVTYMESICQGFFALIPTKNNSIIYNLCCEYPSDLDRLEEFKLDYLDQNLWHSK